MNINKEIPTRFIATSKTLIHYTISNSNGTTNLSTVDGDISDHIYQILQFSRNKSVNNSNCTCSVFDRDQFGQLLQHIRSTTWHDLNILWDKILRSFNCCVQQTNRRNRFRNNRIKGISYP